MMWNGTCPFWNAGAYGAWGWIGMALSLLLWGGLIFGLAYLVVRLARQAGANRMGAVSAVESMAGGSLSAIEIARLRYARGEIDRDAYLKLIEDLR